MEQFQAKTKDRQNRFDVLDALRGLLAIVIAIFHCGNFANQFAGYLAVDCFLILSGFVLAHRYLYKSAHSANSVELPPTPNSSFSGRGNLERSSNVSAEANQKISPVKFIFRRLLRLYPMHVFSLAVLLLFNYFAFHQDPFEFSDSITRLVQNLTLTHIINHVNIWNYPSWSISVEFWINLLFIFYICKSTRIHNLFFLSVLGYCFIFLSFGHLDVSGENINYLFNVGLIRGACGFCLGVLSYRLYLFFKNRIGELKTKNKAFTIFSFLELFLIFICYLLVSPRSYYRDSLDFFVPFVFFIVLVVFAFEKGILSKVFSVLKFKYLGLISYSIYLNHILLLGVFDFIFHTNWFQKQYLIFAYLGSLVIYSSVTYFLIEKGLTKFVRRQVEKVVLRFLI